MREDPEFYISKFGRFSRRYSCDPYLVICDSSNCRDGCMRTCADSDCAICTRECGGGSCSGTDCTPMNCITGCEESCADNDCYSRCGGNCTGDCTGTCRGTCTGDCTGECIRTCLGTCSSTCYTSCQGRCNTACTSTNASTLIANLGLSDIMYAHEVKTIKNAIENEFTRRGRSYSNPYNPEISEGLETFVQYGLKILEDVYNFDYSKDYRSNVEKGQRATKAQMQPAIDYIKALMTQVVY